MKISALVRSKFRVKIKSLAAEARMIRREEARQRSDCDRGVLRGHRVHSLREESRAALLAYAFVRRMPYQAVESKGSREANFARITAIVKSLAGENYLVDEIRAWVAQEVAQEVVRG